MWSSHFSSLTSSIVFFADSSVLTGLSGAASRPAAAAVHPKHPPAPWTLPLHCIPHNDWLPVELQALQAADEIMLLADLPRGVRGDRGEEQCTMGAHHPARLSQADGSWMLLVQSQSQRCGVDLQQDAVPVAVQHWIRSNQQCAWGAFSTSVSELQLSFGQLRKDNEG